jgi:hypothetical protein
MWILQCTTGADAPPGQIRPDWRLHIAEALNDVQSVVAYCFAMQNKAVRVAPAARQDEAPAPGERCRGLDPDQVLTELVESCLES